MKTKTKPLYEISVQATSILYKQLGITATIRFLNQFNIGFGDYTKEREEIFSSYSLAAITSAIKKGDAKKT